MTTSGTAPNDLAERYERLSKAFDALSATLRNTEAWAFDEQKKRHDVEDKLVAERSTVAALEQRLAEATEQLRRQGDELSDLRKLARLADAFDRVVGEFGLEPAYVADAYDHLSNAVYAERLRLDAAVPAATCQECADGTLHHHPAPQPWIHEPGRERCWCLDDMPPSVTGGQIGGLVTEPLGAKRIVCRCGHPREWHKHAPTMTVSYCVSEGECIGCEMFEPMAPAPSMDMEAEGET